MAKPLGPITYTEPPAAVSFALPPRLRLMIADAVTVFSRIDNTLIEIRWAAEGADLARKKAIAKAPAAANIEALKEIVGHFGVGVIDIPLVWQGFERLKDDRNLVGHGVWMVDDKWVPWVMWHSRMLESDDLKDCEHFPYERFDQLLRIARHLLEMLMTFLGHVEQIAAAKKAAAP